MLNARRLRLLSELKLLGRWQRGLRRCATVCPRFRRDWPCWGRMRGGTVEKDRQAGAADAPGRRSVVHTAQVLDILEQAAADLASAQTRMTGTVRISVLQSAALALMPKVLTRMAGSIPACASRQRERETPLHETRTREFDLVIAEQYRITRRPDISNWTACLCQEMPYIWRCRRKGWASASFPRWRTGPRQPGSWNREARRPDTAPSRPAGAPASNPTCGLRRLTFIPRPV